MSMSYKCTIKIKIVDFYDFSLISEDFYLSIFAYFFMNQF